MRKLSFLVLALPAAAIALGSGPAHARTVKQHDPPDAVGPLDIARVAIGQRGRGMYFRLRTHEPLRLQGLVRLPRPDDADARFLCLRMRPTGVRRRTEVCVGPPGTDPRLGYQVLAHGRVLEKGRIPGRVRRMSSHTLRVQLRPRRAGLRPRRYRWRLGTRWSGPICPEPPAKTASRRARARVEKKAPCWDVAPNGPWGKYWLRDVRPVGCVDSGPTPVYHGSRGRKRVALTFDDGPSTYTSKVISILRHHRARGTFFEIGNQVPGPANVTRAVARSGNELANHSLQHESYPGRLSMAATSQRIERASGFRPCLFRPPGGAFNTTVTDNASSLGMTTVLWDVDPADWSRPGSAAIYSRVVSSVQPGSIVVMHDGGGDRSQTVAALPAIIDELRSGGYRCVTVSRLLGQRTRWAPIG